MRADEGRVASEAWALTQRDLEQSQVKTLLSSDTESIQVSLARKTDQGRVEDMFKGKEEKREGVWSELKSWRDGWGKRWAVWEPALTVQTSVS